MLASSTTTAGLSSGDITFSTSGTGKTYYRSDTGYASMYRDNLHLIAFDNNNDDIVDYYEWDLSGLQNWP
ncbi:MAG: hypothetical protein GX421_06185 [Caldisericales bacterium]|nr:hypothetical protein [Caldisericales bacterium]